jgi:hypothetical protein
MKILKYKFLLLLIILLFSCKEGDKNNNVISPTRKKIHDIKGFYFFKQNMSYEDVISVLKENKIKFKVLNLNNTFNGINHPLQGTIEFYEYGIQLKKIKIIEGYNLSILKKQISRFQIWFLDNKIFYFNYQRSFDENQTGFNVDQKILGDINLLTILSEGLRYKYGNPNINNGNLNVYKSPNPEFFNKNDFYSKHSEVFENQIWIGKDSSMQIQLINSLITDSLNVEPFKVKYLTSTTIEVLFNSKFIDELQKFNESIIKKEDSLKNIKRKQFRENEKKWKHQEFEQL